MKYSLATIMLARLRNLDDWSDSLPPGLLDDRLVELRNLIVSVADEHGGRLVPDPVERYPGSFLFRFPAPSLALSAGIGALRMLDSAPPRILAPAQGQLCIAISTGEVCERSGQLIGRPLEIVNVLEGLGAPGRILFTESAFLSLDDPGSLCWRPLHVKIYAEGGPEMRAFELVWK